MINMASSDYCKYIDKVKEFAKAAVDGTMCSNACCL